MFSRLILLHTNIYQHSWKWLVINPYHYVNVYILCIYVGVDGLDLVLKSRQHSPSARSSTEVSSLLSSRLLVSWPFVVVTRAWAAEGQASVEALASIEALVLFFFFAAKTIGVRFPSERRGITTARFVEGEASRGEQRLGWQHKNQSTSNNTQYSMSNQTQLPEYL